MISTIVSVFNEVKNPYLPKIVEQFNNDPDFELIVIDGGSGDGTYEFLLKNKINVVQLKDSTRAARLNYGIEIANGDYVLLQHPRSLICNQGIAYVKQNYKALNWAGFTHRFDTSHPFLKYISWYSNQVRVKKKGVVYLDHCLIVKKSLFPIPAMPDLDIFEDTELSQLLREKCKPDLIPFEVTTSAIRFLDRGIYKQFCLNQFIKFLHYIHINPARINRLYEKKLNLNQLN